MLRLRATQLAESEQARQREEEARRTAEVERARFEERAARADEFSSQLQLSEKAYAGLQEEANAVRIKNAELETRISAEERNLREQREQFEVQIKQLERAFSDLASKALQTNNAQFLDLAREHLDKQQLDAKNELEKKNQNIENLVKPLAEKLTQYQEGLKKLENDQIERQTSTTEQIRRLLEGVDKQLQATVKLEGVFKGPTQRGRMGEILLQRMLEKAGLQPRIHYEMQVTEQSEEGRKRPDCKVFLPGNRQILIDVKTPLNAYEESLEQETEEGRNKKLREHADNVKNRIKEIEKYKDASEQAELRVMYLPLEASLGAATQVEPDLFSFGWDRKIVVTTPTTLFAVLQMVAMDWRQQELQKNADQISGIGKEMVERIRVVIGHLTKVGTNLQTATRSYNDAIGSIEQNLLTTAKRFQKLGSGRDVKVESLPTIEASVRGFAKPEALLPPDPERVRQFETEDALFDLDEVGPSEPSAIPAESESS